MDRVIINSSLEDVVGNAVLQPETTGSNPSVFEIFSHQFLQGLPTVITVNHFHFCDGFRAVFQDLFQLCPCLCNRKPVQVNGDNMTGANIKRSGCCMAGCEEHFKGACI